MYNGGYKSYKPSTNSIGAGQVLHCPYTFEKPRIIIKEMVESLALDLVDKGLVTNQVVLTVGYDIENLTDPERKKKYHGEITTDVYGRKIPKHAHGTANIGKYTSSAKLMMDAVLELYDSIMNRDLLIRRLNMAATHVIDEKEADESYEQISLFDIMASDEKKVEDEKLQKERKLQEAMLDIKKKFGKNAILKGTNLEEGATAMERNAQIGGHKA